MKNMMKYKDYFGSVEFSDEDEVFYGKVEFIRALVSYEGTDVKSLREAFITAVDDYLDLCRQQVIAPEKSFFGKIVLEIPPELYKAIAVESANHHTTPDAWIVDVCRKMLLGSKQIE